MFGHFTYLLFEVLWALPVLGGQYYLGRSTFHLQWRLWLWGSVCPTLFFSLADVVALHVGIWRINPARSTGLSFGTLPLEEALFFMITNIMVVQGVLLLAHREPWLHHVE